MAATPTGAYIQNVTRLATHHSWIREDMNRLATTLMRVFRPGALPQGRADPATFQAFLGTRAAFIAQKTVLDYCGVKFGVQWQRVQADPEFAAALAHCRWAVFWPAAADLTLAAGRALLPHASQPARLAAGLGLLGAASVHEAGSGGDPAAREAAALALRARLATLPEDPPLGPAHMALDAGPVLLETLPVHQDQRKGERAAILGGLRMNLIAMLQDMERLFDPAPLAAAIEATAPPE
jgi:hypothetical protein